MDIIDELEETQDELTDSQFMRDEEQINSHELSPVKDHQSHISDTPKSVRFNRNQMRNNMFNFDNSPINPGVDGKKIKTFEQLLDETLSNDSLLSGQEEVETQVKPKRPFLKKGEGLVRFNMKKHELENVRRLVTKVDAKVDSKADKRICELKDGSKKEKKYVKSVVKDDNKENNNKRNILKRPQVTNSNTKTGVYKPTQMNLNAMKVSKTQKIKNSKPLNDKIVEARNCKHLTSGRSDIIIERNENINRKLTSSRICNNIFTSGSSNGTRKDVFSNGNDKNDGIDELESLLQKIELTKRNIREEIDNDCEEWLDLSDHEEKQHKHHRSHVNSLVKKKKKKVKWSNKVRCSPVKANTSIKAKVQRQFSIESFDEPQIGAYSMSLKKQIIELENKMSALKGKCDERKQAKLDEKLQQKISSNNDFQLLMTKLDSLNARLRDMEVNQLRLNSPSLPPKSQHKKMSIFESKPTKEKYIARNDSNATITNFENYKLVDFANGDKMKLSNDKTIFYSYASNGAQETLFPDGLRIINYPNGQIEKVHISGIKHIIYPNGSQRIINPDSSEEVFMSDGTVLRITCNGTEYLELPNGDREVRTQEYKRREYVDGTVKTIHSNGTQETRYANGRLRIRDKDGNLIVDSHMKYLDQMANT